MLVPRAGGTATEQLWGQAVWHPWAQPSRVPLGPGSLSPVHLGGSAPGGPIPSLQRTPTCRLSPKSLSQRLMAVVDWAPHLPSIPATFGHPPHSSPLPAQPYPFQVELSWGGGSRGARRGGEGVRGDEREKRSKKGQHWGERAGHPTSYKKTSWIENGSFIRDQLLNDIKPGLGVMCREGVGIFVTKLS